MKIIVANWKMNPVSVKEAEKLFLEIVKLTKLGGQKIVKVVIASPFIYLEKLKNLSDKTNNKIGKKIFLGAQNIANVSENDFGPYTGEISAKMLKNIGIDFVILGHSERRSIGENNLDINKKIKAALLAKITPILCIGEKERDNLSGKQEYLNFITTQLREGLLGIPKNALKKIIIAYEPIWSISSTPNCVEASASDSYEMAIFIKRILCDMSSPKIASGVKILYGGSVNQKNAEDFLRNGGVDGLLVGGASLDPKKFSAIVKYAQF